MKDFLYKTIAFFMCVWLPILLVVFWVVAFLNPIFQNSLNSDLLDD